MWWCLVLSQYWVNECQTNMVTVKVILPIETTFFAYSYIPYTYSGSYVLKPSVLWRNINLFLLFSWHVKAESILPLRRELKLTSVSNLSILVETWVSWGDNQLAEELSQQQLDVRGCVRVNGMCVSVRMMRYCGPLKVTLPGLPMALSATVLRY